MSSWLAGALAVSCLGLAAGCGNPCETLAERTCEKVGESAPLCEKARENAENAGPIERATCERAVKLYEAAVEE